MFKLPEYVSPDFSEPRLLNAPPAAVVPAPADRLLPDDFYATTIFPEYFKIDGEWRLIAGPRMDCAVVIKDGQPRTVEARLIKCGDMVVVGRSDDGTRGVYVDHLAFTRREETAGSGKQVFAFRTGRSRESSYSLDYDLLYDILRHERDNGYIVWVLGPAAVFDYDSRRAMASIISHGYAHAVCGQCAGNTRP
jgi:hypothetical protein